MMQQISGFAKHKTARWYLSFDCATKTLAFSLIRVEACPDINEMRALRARRLLLLNELQMIKSERPENAAKIDRLAEATTTLAKETNFITFVDGETVDLFPGRADRNIHTVERVKALSAYVARRIKPSLTKNGATAATLVIEFQMGANAPARTIAAALIAMFASHDTYLVGPSLKNKLEFGPNGQYYKFVEKYARLYDANKEHTRHNFAYLEQVFGTKIPPSQSSRMRGHIADSVMQVLGWIAAGQDTAEMF